MTEDLPQWPDFGTCDRCGHTITGSHYHCAGCGADDITGMYGHHGSWCRITKSQRAFHHCGPDNNCSLKEAGE